MTARGWLIGALAAVLVQAVPANHQTPLEIDEQVAYYIAHGQTPGGVWKRAFEQSATPPFSFWLMRASSGVGELIGAGSREFWLRFPSLIAYLVSVVLVWRLVRRTHGASAGSAAAVILALHSVGVDKMALQARPYALGLMFALLALDQLHSLKCGRWCSTDASLLGLALAGLPWTHYLFGVFWLPAFLQIALAREYAGFRGKLFGTLFLAGLWCLPLMPGALRVGAIGPALAWITEPPSWKPLEAIVAPIGVAAAMAAALAFRVLPAPAGAPTSSTVNHRSMVWIVAWAALPFAVLVGMAQAWNQPSLAQLRYILPTLGAAAAVMAGLFAATSRGRSVAIVALVYSIAAGHASHGWRRVRQPVWHDSEWKEAGGYLRDHAASADLVFVQPGLVEANLTPARFHDAGFQEYATSRLSDFYAGRGFTRLALPMLFPAGGEYVLDYARRVEAVRQAGGTVWLVVSADTDLGQGCQRRFEEWIKSLEFDVEVVRPDPVARVLRCSPRK
jgi:hypothetical protein